MRNKLPERIKKHESGIANLDNDTGNGTHWRAYIKKGNKIIYFDNYADLRPLSELNSYFYRDNNKNIITYNYSKHLIKQIVANFV